MARNPDYQVIDCQFVILDAKGKKGRFHFYAVNNESALGIGPVAIQDFLQFTAQKLDPLIDGQIIDISARIITELPSGIKTAPLANSDREEGGLFHWRTTNNASVLMRVPTFDENEVNLNPYSSALSDFTNIFTNPEIDNLYVYPASSHAVNAADTDEQIVHLEDLTEAFKPK